MIPIVILIRLLLSAVLGGLIGLEREMHGCAAGLRTHILVSIGSTLFMITSVSIAVTHGYLGDVDPSRIAAGVVTGIGFLGAGAIIRYGASIRGLTTAASIWSVSAIGLAVGMGMYIAAGITTVIALSVLILSRLEERIALKKHGKILVVSLRSDSENGKEAIRKIIEIHGGLVKRISTDEFEGEGNVDVVCELILPRIHHKYIVEEISSLPGVDGVVWK